MRVFIRKTRPYRLIRATFRASLDRLIESLQFVHDLVVETRSIPYGGRLTAQLFQHLRRHCNARDHDQDHYELRTTCDCDGAAEKVK
ncbi:MAG TPA: hypothetical protein VH110_01805 [Candidatus Acidoferrum sp.]|nr:hypothetical protein [Candidatus Acidoferrum sp.]